MSIYKRFGFFVFLFFIICILMVCYNENFIIKKLSISENDVIVFENNNTKDGVSFETSLKPFEIINKLNAKIHSEQKLNNNKNDLLIYYCYIENLNNYVIVDNKKVNMQIAYDGKKTTVGIPLILTGY